MFEKYYRAALPEKNQVFTVRSVAMLPYQVPVVQLECKNSNCNKVVKMSFSVSHARLGANQTSYIWFLIEQDGP